MASVDPDTAVHALDSVDVVGADTWLETSLDHPEAVAVDENGMLYTGGEAGQIYRVDPVTNAVEELARTPGFVLGVALGPDGDLFACDFQRHAVFRLPLAPDGSPGDLEITLRGGPDRPPLQPNYLAFDRDGRLYVSDSGRREHLPGPFEDSGGKIVALDPDGSRRVVTEAFPAFPNGIALDASGETLYVCETGTHRIGAVHLADGEAVDTEVVTDECGMVDGLALDAADRLYIASIGDNAVYRYDPGSETLELLVADPSGMAINNPTNVAFGGPDLQTLYIANLGASHITRLPIEATGRYPTGQP